MGCGVKNYTSIFTRANYGLDAPRVSVEVHLSNGLPALNIVGLANAEVKESKERVRSAIINSGFEFPARRITINLAPAELPKSGGRYDLAIAVGILVASKQLPADQLAGCEFLAELSLNGDTRPVTGILASMLQAKLSDLDIWVAKENIEEAIFSGHKKVISVSSLKSLAKKAFESQPTYIETKALPEPNNKALCLSQVIGNEHAKRALVLAVVGGHNLLMLGTPGSGKTMLARCIPGLLPPLTMQHAREIAAIESMTECGPDYLRWREVRVRAPHHSCSQVALTGGGRRPKPGEISLAHHGILFLDELPEFNRSVLEALRQPLEEGFLTVSRAEWKISFPAQFQLVAAMNPCPCGYRSSQRTACRCSESRIEQYLTKVSGPLLDRIDIQVQVNESSMTILDKNENINWSSARLQPIIAKVRTRQIERQGCLNKSLTIAEIRQIKAMHPEAKQLFKTAAAKLNLSMRSQVRALRLALTISDWAEQKAIQPEHIAEALSYRALDIMQKGNQLTASSTQLN